MNDPVMQQILQQAQNDPGALQDHMKNSAVRQKIQKLINAGIIRTRWRIGFYNLSLGRPFDWLNNIQARNIQCMQ